MRAAALALLLASSAALAREGLEPVNYHSGWGFGFTLGDPFGLSLKHYLGGSQAWDLYAAFAYGPGIRFGGDWIWTLGRAVKARQFDVDVYAGVGPFVGTFQGPCGPGFITDRCNGDAYFGGRVPFGAEMLFREAPVSVGVEVAPGIAFAASREGLLLDFLLAFRYLF
jgi:hypothetical protein